MKKVLIWILIVICTVISTIGITSLATNYYVSESHNCLINVTNSPTVSPAIRQSLYANSDCSLMLGDIDFGSVAQGGTASKTIYTKDVLPSNITVNLPNMPSSGLIFSKTVNDANHSITITVTVLSTTVVTGYSQGISFYSPTS
jgi:hypothetical protein